jgi:MFS family permease
MDRGWGGDLPSIVIIGYWFEKKRAFATGMALCGSGIGTLLFSSFNTYLLAEYDIKNGTVILAGVVLQCAICGACYRPLYKVKRTPRMKRGIVSQGLIMKALIAEKERLGLPEVGFFPVGLPEVDYFLGNLLVNLNSHIHYPFSFHNLFTGRM